MKLRYTLPALLLLITSFTTVVFAAESVSVNFTYGGSHNTDFSGYPTSLRVTEFTDDRGGDANLIAGDYVADQALADIVRDALIQGFQHGDATLMESGEDMQIAGRIVSSQLQMVDRGGVESIQLTVRTNVQLQGRGRMIWQTTLFGRGVVPVGDGIVAALHAALDRSIRELVGDDYFLIELQ